MLSEAAESAGPESMVFFTGILRLREPGPTGCHIAGPPFLHLPKITPVPNGGNSAPRGAHVSLPLQISCNGVLPQLMPSIRDLKEDHKVVGEIHCSVLKPRHRITMLSVPESASGEPVWTVTALEKSAANKLQDFSLPDP